MPVQPLRRALATITAAATVAGLAVAVVAPLPAAAELSATGKGKIKIKGHGWGHGRGMGQYGGFGYAVDHDKDYAWILDHFYRPTSAGSISTGQTITVRLVAHDDRHTIAFAPGGLESSVTGGSVYDALRVRHLGDHHYGIDWGSGCGGPWTEIAPDVEGPVKIRPASGGAENFVQTCEPDGSRRAYRGEIWATKDSEGPQRTVNRLKLEDYLRGVVPRESPASWGDSDGGNGMHALRAQAVAARSYAASESRYTYADTCDTTACQVYGGYWHSSTGSLEAGNTNTAIAETAGEVRVLNGAVARTEFSSSTGGWTTGTSFKNVRDRGDDTASNPNHDWTTSVSVSSIESAFPEVGKFRKLRVTERNGKGDWGGRVVEMKVVGKDGKVVVSGDTFRSRLGLKSDWFTFAGAGSGKDQAEKPKKIRTRGYWAVSRVGGFYALGKGDLPFFGSAAGIATVGEFVDAMAHPSGQGYYAVTDRGAVYAFDAPFYGAATDIATVGRFVAALMHPSGRGYYLITSEGAVYTFGDIPFYGAATDISVAGEFVTALMHPSGRGYYLITDEGAVYTFGRIPFHGAATNVPHNGIAAAMMAPDGSGYALVSRAAGVYAYGDFEFQGSLGNVSVVGTPVAAVAHPRGGYYVLTDAGALYAFDAPFFGSLSTIPHPGMIDLLWYPKAT